MKNSAKKLDFSTRCLLAGFPFDSEMAGINTLLELLNPSNPMAGVNDLYRRTVHFLNQIKQRYSNLSFSYIDMADLNNLNQQIKPEIKLFLGCIDE
jgi:cystathionine beta-lyase/cystathionine gamma-synthase